MKVSPVNSTVPQFKAKVAKTKEYNALISYLDKHSNSTIKVYDTSADKVLVQKVTQALEAFPTDAELDFGVLYKINELFNARGAVKSQYAILYDTEPARDDSYVPIPNIMKRILNPENKEQFNKLMGNKSDNIRDIWWKFYIAPIWNSIKINFHEDTVYPPNAEPDYDLMFRQQNKVI